MKSIEVRYFAMFREMAGKEKENLNVDMNTLTELYHYLGQRYNFTLPADMIQVAVDDEFTHMNSAITDNSRIVFIPPVAGG